MTNKLQFGRLSTSKLCRNLFYLGCFPILPFAIGLSIKAAMRLPYDRNIQTVDGWFTSVPEPNYLLGIGVGLIFLCLAAALWWHICEIIYHLIQYLRSNTQPSSTSPKTCEDNQE